jgi:hypothetical protein
MRKRMEISVREIYCMKIIVYHDNKEVEKQ